MDAGGDNVAWGQAVTVEYEQQVALTRDTIGIYSTDIYRPSLGEIAVNGTPATLGDGRIFFIIQEEHIRATALPTTWRVYLWH